jgi:hypothetical protein
MSDYRSLIRLKEIGITHVTSSPFGAISSGAIRLSCEFLIHTSIQNTGENIDSILEENIRYNGDIGNSCVEICGKIFEMGCYFDCLCPNELEIIEVYMLPVMYVNYPKFQNPETGVIYPKKDE